VSTVRIACNGLLIAAVMFGASPCLAGPKPIGAILISGAQDVATVSDLPDATMHRVSLRVLTSAPQSAELDVSDVSDASASLRDIAMKSVRRWRAVPAAARGDGWCIVEMYFSTAPSQLAERKHHRYLTVALH
jgi:hypothetical protein